MKTLLYSISLTSEQRRIIKRSLFSLFVDECQSSSTLRLIRIRNEFNLCVKPCERVFLSTDSWLLVLRALRAKMLKYSTSTVLRLKYASLGFYICRHIEAVEGDLSYTYKVFRFFKPF